MTLFKAMATVGGLTGLSRIAGFIRDVLTAVILGAGPVADAFFVALKLPNFFRKVTAEGAFSVSFVPKYSEVLEKDGDTHADLFASRVFTLMFGILSLVALLMMLIMPWVIFAIAPGFQGDPLRYDLAVELSVITFPYLVLMSLTALMGGVLNARDRFGPFAAAPILFNLALIAALLLSDFFETVGHAMAWGVIAAGILQFLWLALNIYRARVALGLTVPRVTDNIREVLRRMGPGVIGAGVLQINLFADMIIASFLQAGAISYLYYADRLNQLPLGVIGIAVGTALLPMLSKTLAADRPEEARGLFNRALEMCLLLGLPAAVALLIVPHILIFTLFEYGAFTAEDTTITGYVLMGYAVGLPAYIGVKVLSSVFWAQGDTSTPVKIAIIATCCNIILSLILIQFLGVAGITFATGLVGWLHYAHLNRLLPQGMQYDDRLKGAALKIFAAAGGMGLFLIGFSIFSGALFTDAAGLLLNILGLIGMVLSGAGVYAALILALKVTSITEIKTYFRKT